MNTHGDLHSAIAERKGEFGILLVKIGIILVNIGILLVNIGIILVNIGIILPKLEYFWSILE